MKIIRRMLKINRPIRCLSQNEHSSNRRQISTRNKKANLNLRKIIHWQVGTSPLPIARLALLNIIYTNKAEKQFFQNLYHPYVSLKTRHSGAFSIL